MVNSGSSTTLYHTNHNSVPLCPTRLQFPALTPPITPHSSPIPPTLTRKPRPTSSQPASPPPDPPPILHPRESHRTTPPQHPSHLGLKPTIPQSPPPWTHTHLLAVLRERRQRAAFHAVVEPGGNPSGEHPCESHGSQDLCAGGGLLWERVRKDNAVSVFNLPPQAFEEFRQKDQFIFLTDIADVMTGALTVVWTVSTAGVRRSPPV